MTVGVPAASPQVKSEEESSVVVDPLSVLDPESVVDPLSVSVVDPLSVSVVEPESVVSPESVDVLVSVSEFVVGSPSALGLSALFLGHRLAS